MNNLKYASSIIGLLSASLALITYSIAHIPAVIATIWERNELKILEFATNEELIVANTGNKNLIITNIQLKINKQKKTKLNQLEFGLSTKK